MDSSIINLIIAIIFFIIGAATVGLIWYFQMVMKRGQDKSKKVNLLSEDQTEIARLIRDNKTQDLVVEMEGTPYNNFHELTPVLQRRLNFTSNVLVKWLAAPAPQPVAEGETSTEPAQTLPAEAAASTPAMYPVEPTDPDAHPDWVPPFSADSDSEIKPVSTNLPDVVGSILSPTPQPAPQFKSIAMQINDVLQAQLAGTALETRGITVNDAPDHGVIFTLDGEKYPGLKDVPDEEVRRAIRAAVLEWETRK